jgi:hypothetical protein
MLCSLTAPPSPEQYRVNEALTGATRRNADMPGHTRLVFRTFLAVAVPCLGLWLAGCQSNGLVVSSVNDYSHKYGPGCPKPPCLPNSIANGDGFIQAMTVAGSGWTLTERDVDSQVDDMDFVDAYNMDAINFDQPKTAISYFTGHGTCGPYGANPPQACTSTTQCVNPVPGTRMPGSCKFGPGDIAQCVYLSNRALFTDSGFDRFGGRVDYSGGSVHWGESPNAGGWAGAGTDGGTNLVVLDISCGVLPTFWVQQLQPAMAGIHMLATIMPVTGDTANVADRGAAFGGSWAARPSGSVADAWLTTMNSIPGSGINGGGCNFVIAFDATPAAAVNNLNQNWNDLKNDGWDAKGASAYVGRWLCNWAFSQTDQSAFELP